MKPEDNTAKAIIDLARGARDLQRRAEEEYRPVVDAILRAGSRDAAQIERTLDGLLDFCGYEPVLAMYQQLCSHYGTFDPIAAADCIDAYRERWGDDQRAGEGSHGR